MGGSCTEAKAARPGRHGLAWTSHLRCWRTPRRRKALCGSVKLKWVTHVETVPESNAAFSKVHFSAGQSIACIRIPACTTISTPNPNSNFDRILSTCPQELDNYPATSTRSFQYQKETHKIQRDGSYHDNPQGQAPRQGGARDVSLSLHKMQPTLRHYANPSKALFEGACSILLASRYDPSPTLTNDLGIQLTKQLDRFMAE